MWLQSEIPDLASGLLGTLNSKCPVRLPSYSLASPYLLVNKNKLPKNGKYVK